MAKRERGIKVGFDKQNLKVINDMFKQLPKQVAQHKVWIKFWRHNSKPLQKAAKQNAEAIGGTGQLARSIGFFTTKASREFMGGYVGPRVKGAYGKMDLQDKSGKELKGKKMYTKSGFYGAFVEYGGEVMHWGKATSKNQPFMKKAWASAHKQVLMNGMRDAATIFQRALKIHERRLKKYGRFGY